MDPLSVLASVAGIATAGTSLSIRLFRLANSVRHAPRNIQSIATEISELTSVLEHLHEALSNGHEFMKSTFLESVDRAAHMVKSTQEDISATIEDRSALRKFKWAKAEKGFLSAIEKHKITILLQTSVVSMVVSFKNVKQTPRTSHSKTENRFRLQAESLVQAGQASFEAMDSRDRSESYSRSLPARAPSPPVRTSKRQPSPVRVSHVPGHMAPTEATEKKEKPFQSQYLEVPGQDRKQSVGDSGLEDESCTLQDSRALSIRSGKSRAESSPEDDKRRQQRKQDRERATNWGPRDLEPLSFKLSNFGRKFREQGDAATFLYRLVFEDVAKRGAPQFSQPLQASDDSSSEDEIWDDSEGAPIFSRGRSRTRNLALELAQPTRVVNRLLEQWTSLSPEEIEQSVFDGLQSPTKSQPPQQANKPWQRSRSQESQSEWDDRSESGVPIEPVKAQVQPKGDTNLWGKPRPNRHVLRADWPPKPTVTTEPSSPANGPVKAETAEAKVQPEVYSDPSSNMYTSVPDNIPYLEPPMAPQRQYPMPYIQPPIFHPVAKTEIDFQEVQSSSQDGAEKPVRIGNKRKRSPFRKPDTVVLPSAYEVDLGSGSSTPDLDVLRAEGYKMQRQDETCIWNANEFATKHGVKGNPIMASLVGDAIGPNLGLDLSYTLFQGQDAAIVYVRGSALGETWFINEQPVFLQFLHCAYEPQFFPARRESSISERDGYVAIGEEWATEEAISQLGLAVKRREDGRVFLEPSIPWRTLRGLATMTLQLRCMRQHRQFNATFYNSVATFRKTHGKGPLSIVDVSPPHLKDIRGTVSLEQPKDADVNVFSFQVENKDDPGPSKDITASPALPASEGRDSTRPVSQSQSSQANDESARQRSSPRSTMSRLFRGWKSKPDPSQLSPASLSSGDSQRHRLSQRYPPSDSGIGSLSPSSSRDINLPI